MGSNKKIVIGIPTFRRPWGLSRLLASIAKLDVQFSINVLVADNDKDKRQGIAVVEQVRKDGFPFSIIGIVVPDRGISQVRNALMRNAFEILAADGLAMVDDDEIVETNWLSKLVAMQEKGGFDVVGGLTLPEFEESPPEWSKGLRIYWRRIHNPGAISIIQSTVNILLHRSLHERFRGCNFNPEFGLTGGEDKEFFTRLKQKGAKFGFATEAKSHEYISSSRMTRRWALQRAFRIGWSDARVFQLNMHRQKDSGYEVVKLSGALLISSICILSTIWSPNLQMKACMTLVRQFGKLNSLFGSPPQIYKVIHGK